MYDYLHQFPVLYVYLSHISHVYNTIKLVDYTKSLEVFVVLSSLWVHY